MLPKEFLTFVAQNLTMQPMRWVIFIFICFASVSFSWYDANPIGKPIDNLNGVNVYFNGKDFTNVVGRNVTPDGYNLGLKYQCVEFVKRYYYEVMDHKMPNTYGHARLAWLAVAASNCGFGWMI